MSPRAAVLPPPADAPAAQRNCLHCGDACRDEAIVNAAGSFCCRGCESVFAIIADRGLEDFYACEVAPGTSQRAAASRLPGRYAPLDVAGIAGRFIESDRGGVVRARFTVPAIHCASCIWLLEQLWRFDAGITRSEVDLIRRTIRVEFLSSRTSLRAVAEVLGSLGYEPLLDGERPAGRLSPERRTLYLRIGLAGFAFGNVMLFSIPRYANGGPLEPAFRHLFGALNILFAIPVLLYSAAPYFGAAWHAGRARRITLEVPIALGLAVLFTRSVVDIVSGRGEGFLDSFSGLVFFLLIGRLFQQQTFDRIAFDRTVRSFFPLSVHVEREGGPVPTPIERLRPGDVLVLRPSEVVPADATLLDDCGRFDYAFVNGESVPATLCEGEPVPAGGRVVDCAVRVRVDRAVSQSRLVSLWSDPVFGSPKPHWLTDVSARLGAWFTWGALAVAAAGALAWWPDAGRAASVATAVLIIACPCALTLAAPVTLGTAMTVLGRAGWFLKGPAVVLDLSRIDTIAFDKTGTLVTAEPAAAVFGGRLDEAAWARAGRLAAQSVHPISRALASRASGRRPELSLEVAGQGVAGRVDGCRVVIGNAAFVAANTGLPVGDRADRTWIAVDHALGWMAMEQRGRAGMFEAVRALAARYRLWVLSGDHPRHGFWDGIPQMRTRFEMSAGDKLTLLRDCQQRGERVLMVGDGLNDAGALAGADVGLAVSDDTACLVPACDAVVAGHRLPWLPAVLDYARRARRVLALCFTVSVVYNAIGLSLALRGVLTPLTTAVLMPVSSLSVVGLAAGLMRIRTAGLLR